MANTLKGMGAVWGVGALTFSGVVITSSVAKYQSMDYARESDEAELLNESGETVGLSLFDHRRRINLSVIPTGASVAAARTNLSTCLPDVGELITLTADPNISASSPQTMDTHGGKYIVESASNSRTNNGFSIIDLVVKQFENADISATI